MRKEFAKKKYVKEMVVNKPEELPVLLEWLDPGEKVTVSYQAHPDNNYLVEFQLGILKVEDIINHHPDVHIKSVWGGDNPYYDLEYKDLNLLYISLMSLRGHIRNWEGLDPLKIEELERIQKILDLVTKAIDENYPSIT